MWRQLYVGFRHKYARSYMFTYMFTTPAHICCVCHIYVRSVYVDLLHIYASTTLHIYVPYITYMWRRNMLVVTYMWRQIYVGFRHKYARSYMFTYMFANLTHICCICHIYVCQIYVRCHIYVTSIYVGFTKHAHICVKKHIYVVFDTYILAYIKYMWWFKTYMWLSHAHICDFLHIYVVHIYVG